jgi:glycosyltransferase involved in cell wall biosynthesis
MGEKRRKFRQDYQIKDDEIAIGIVGRLVPIKNHVLFLDGLRHVMDRSRKKIRAFIVGDGECRERLENKARELNIPFSGSSDKGRASVLTFTSWLKDVDYVYAGMDIVSLTSLNEGTPVSLIEAQAACKPIVTTNVGGIENIIVENGTALLSRKADYSDYPGQLYRLVEDDGLRSRMSQQGWSHVNGRYHYTRLVDDMKSLYARLLYN